MKKWFPLMVLMASTLSLGAAFLQLPPIPHPSHSSERVVLKSEWKEPARAQKMSWENSLETAFRVHRLISVSS